MSNNLDAGKAAGREFRLRLHVLLGCEQHLLCNRALRRPGTSKMLLTTKKNHAANGASRARGAHRLTIELLQRTHMPVRHALVTRAAPDGAPPAGRARSPGARPRARRRRPRQGSARSRARPARAAPSRRRRARQDTASGSVSENHSSHPFDRTGEFTRTSGSPPLGPREGMYTSPSSALCKPAGQSGAEKNGRVGGCTYPHRRGEVSGQAPPHPAAPRPKAEPGPSPPRDTGPGGARRRKGGRTTRRGKGLQARARGSCRSRGRRGAPPGRRTRRTRGPPRGCRPGAARPRGCSAG